MNRRAAFLIMMVVMLAMTGCARLMVKPEKNISASAAVLLERVAAFNARLTAAKGIGTLAPRSGNTIPRMRFAWLCKLPDKIRLEFLAPTGTPLLTLAADGNIFYFLPLNGDGRLHKEKEAKVNLKKAIAIPLTVSDACFLLAGRIPLHDFDTAERIELAGGNYMLQLKGRRPDRMENVTFDQTTDRPCKIEFFLGPDRELEYSASFIAERPIEKETVPESIILENGPGEAVVITISRFWPQADIPDEKFILTDAP